MKHPIADKEILWLSVLAGAVFGYSLIQGLAQGAFKTKAGQWVNRKDQPFWFWLVMAVHMAGISVAIFGVMAARPH